MDTYLRDDNKSNDSKQHGHDQSDPSGPAPTTVEKSVLIFCFRKSMVLTDGS
jgi:hypothetical protein